MFFRTTIRRSAVACCILVCCNSCLREAESQNIVRFADGAPHERLELISVAEGAVFQFRTTNEKARSNVVRLDGSQLLRYGEPPVAKLASFVLLGDGSEFVLRGESGVKELVDDDLVVQSDLFGETRLHVDSIRAIVFQSPSEMLQRNRLAYRLLQTSPSADQVVLTSGDVLTGRIDSIDRDSVVLLGQDRSRTISRSLVAMVALDPRYATRPNDDEMAMIGLSDGSILRSYSLTVSQKQIRFKLFDGQAVTSRSSVRPIEEQTIVFLQPVGANPRYLSDLKPIQYRHVPYLSGTIEYGLNRGLRKNGLETARHQRAAKGVALPSTSRLTFRIPAGYADFAAELALGDSASDDSTKMHGSVIFRVFLQTSDGWSEAYRSPVVRADTDPIFCRIRLGTATAISLIADYAEQTDLGDEALWIDARFAR